MHWPEIEYFIGSFKPGLEPGLESPKILDIWCWSWRLLPYLKKAFDDFKYLWIDSSEWMINEAKKEHPNYDFRTLDMTDLDKIGTKFDMVFFIASFHHIESFAQRINILNMLGNILAPGWIVYMTNWNLMWEYNFKKYEKAYRWDHDFDIKIGWFSRYYHSFTLDELEGLFKETNFDIIENRIFEWDNNLISIVQK